MGTSRGSGKFVRIEDAEWRVPKRPNYCVHVRLIPEDGGVTAVACCLPGVADWGKDEREALANIMGAARLALKTYLELGMPIPWRRCEDHIPGTKVLVVEV